MRRLVDVLGVAGLMAAILALTAGAALAQAVTEKEQVELQESFTGYNPCTGEEILWEGRWTANIHVTTNESGRHALTVSHYINLTGTGLETGDEYRATGTGRWTQFSNYDSDTDMYREIYNETGTGLTISKGDSPNYLGRYQVRLTKDGYVEVVSQVCTPNGEPQWPEEAI